MSYEIMYQRRIIKLGENEYLPLIQQGSNNCFEYSDRGKPIPEKYWNILNYPYRNKYIFSMQDIDEIAKKHSKYEWFKSRNRKFSEEEFYQFIMSGIKSAQPIEYYINLGNHPYISYYDDNHEYITKSITSTNDLKTYLQYWESIGYEKGNVGFRERDLFLERVKKDISIDKYYIIKIDNNFLLKVVVNRYGRYRLKLAQNLKWNLNEVKKFKTKKDAENYINKYGLDRYENIEIIEMNNK